ncbi:receptor-like protein EIX1 [Lactuca sativa]|nr:receptor-like protein EIX1 [Lactuca sativa]
MHLKYLDLGDNDFGGSRIPDFIGSLKHLTYLSLSNARFQGIIPDHIGNLSNLKVLDLSLNSKLVVEDVSWTFGLSSLEHLDLSSLNLVGARNLDMVLHMIIPSLKKLSLSCCGLSNADFQNSSRIVSNIEHLDLGFNSFKGPLPGFLKNMTSLITFLDLSDFDVSLAWNFANLLNMILSLRELHLSSCGLHNTFLSSIHLNFSTLSNIQHLDLGDNSIEGMFPSLFTNMSSLKVLDLSRNSLSSWVPVMPNLLELDLSFNEFKQIEHVGIWRHCQLKQLNATSNSFDKEIIDSPKNKSECSGYALEILD